jgi:hypothetical protein
VAFWPVCAHVHNWLVQPWTTSLETAATGLHALAVTPVKTLGV